jgi:NAD(P)-dependent dehydrogenase (short-subunit alcohol dehydrogenase family)
MIRSGRQQTLSGPADATYPSLVDRTVFISGGASGIGEAIVRAFAGQGSKVGFVDLLEEEGSRLAAELREQGVKVEFVRTDITDVAALRAAIAQIADALGPISVLVNNAANDMRHDWRTETPESWDARLAVNLKHQFFATQAVALGMIEAGGGSIINFGSISWMIGQGGMPAYTSSKSAVHGLTRSFARDLGKHRIRVNAVLPGWVMTKRQLELWVDENTERVIAENQCLPDRLTPDDIARMVLFLAADDSAMCTAQAFIVDGGWV